MFVKKEDYEDPEKGVSIPRPDYVDIIYAKDYKEANKRIKKHMPKGYKLGVTNITKIEDGVLINLITNKPILV